MSLSQKHAGLILVPWFNSHEWNYVYQMVYSNAREQQSKGLEILKIWKLRTPVLSAGVEGTLILLDVLLLDTDSLSNEQISNLYAIALMRFLNLSAANSEKQGSFTKTSTKNELPKWIVNLRHDIAHGHQIPSLYNLKMALDFGFSWLKEKYWEPQRRLIKDYCITEHSNTDNYFTNSLKAYIEINIALFETKELENDYVQSISKIIYKKFKRTVDHPYLMLDILLELITQSLEQNHEKDQIGLDILISPGALLKPYFANPSEEQENEAIDTNFRNIWQNLFNIYHQYGLLFKVIEKFYEVVSDISYSENSKKMAALWINELLISLGGLNSLGKTEESGVQLVPNQYNYSTEASNLQKCIIFNSSEFLISSKFVNYFINSLIKYNQNNDRFSSDVEMIKSKTSDENMHQDLDKIYTLDDLKVEHLTLEDADVMENENLERATLVGANLHVSGENKWRRVEDTTIFKNCPLGILPHQLGQKHPFLALG